MILKSQKICLSLLVLCSVHQLINCERNKTRKIIPVETKMHFPQTYERITVESDPGEPGNSTEPSVPEFIAETNLEVNTNVPKSFALTDEGVKQVKRAPKVYDDGKGNYYDAYSFITRSDHPRSGKPPPLGPTPRPIKSNPNKIQPLHIKTQGFKKNRPQQHNGKPYKEDKHKLKLEHLPPNPTTIPKTDWFDNTGKYYYGIVHGESYTEPPEYSAQQKLPLQQNNQKQDASTEQGIEIPAEPIFKSSYHDSKHAHPFVYNDGLGKFLYKSEIHYPLYRNQLFSPVIPYVEPHNEIPATKELPIEVVHHRPQVTTSAPKQEHRTADLSIQAKQAEDEDYEDESSEDEDENAHNDRYEGEAPSDDDEGGEDDEESESEEKSYSPSYRYESVNDDEDGSSRSYESDDAFEDAWGKYGYGRDNGHEESDSGSYESSETQQIPHRIKFYHEKMEKITTPMRQTTETPKLKEITKVVVGKLMNNSSSKPKSPSKPKGVKSQDNVKENPESQRSSGAAAAGAGSDDLKYFQFFNYMGNGVHTAGGRSGNDNHYVEHHERANKPLGVFQKKVRWADKNGGFGEHYWDLNH